MQGADLLVRSDAALSYPKCTPTQINVVENEILIQRVSFLLQMNIGSQEIDIQSPWFLIITVSIDPEKAP